MHMDRTVQYLGNWEPDRVKLIQLFNDFFASGKHRQDTSFAGYRLRLTRYRGTVKAVSLGVDHD